MGQDSTGVNFVCEHCEKSFHYEFQTPIAVRCSHCDSIFDARLQIAKLKDKEQGKKPETSTE
ncbi:MAG: hypothetical protein ACYC7D_03935 [Nitrososphaerales archaeon]